MFWYFSVSESSDNESETSANETSERDDTIKEEDVAKHEETDKVDPLNVNVKTSSSGGKQHFFFFLNKVNYLDILISEILN